MNEDLPRLLLVDDEQNVIDGIARRLRREYEIFSANDGQTALRLLEHHGEAQIIVSDMRMPGMSGASLLAQTCKLYPDMVRILLTGHADLEAAIMAVNEGQIFRFLLKPCSAELLRHQLGAAMRQHELVCAERVLLEQTLNGAVQILSDVLSLAMPEAFGKATRVRERARVLADRLGLPNLWRIEVAATLSQVGAVTLAAETAIKLYRAEPLAADEQAAVDRLPSTAVELLKPIPRFAEVRELISLGFATNAPVPRALEAQVLRVCVEYDALHDAGQTNIDALALLGRRGFEPELLAAFAVIVSEDTRAHTVEVSFPELSEGMVLAEDLYGANGMLLLARGNTIRKNVIERLRAVRVDASTRQKLRVRLPE